MSRNIILVGGGTGGHITPILSLSQDLEKRGLGIKVITVGGTGEIDQRLYSGCRNHIALQTGKLHRSLTLSNIVQLFLFLSGLVTSFRILRQLKPRLIFSKAGYVSFPIIFWSRILKIPYFIHESDIEMGASNKFAAKQASKVFVGFPVSNYPNVEKEKLEFVGQILRPDFTKKEGSNFDFGLDKKKAVIFVTGGSQGSTNINRAVFQILSGLLPDYSIIHHTGNLDYNNAIEIRSKLSPSLQDSYFISPLLTMTAQGIDMMKSAIFQADIVITRASATTLAELSVLEKAIIAVPYKYAASDHQSKNADYYEKNKAAFVISDDDLTGEILRNKINALAEHPDNMKAMGKRASALQDSNGLKKISNAIIEFINIRKNKEK